jgi:molybdenum cofactor guanylyltransferase
MNRSAIILCGGASSRMGRDKALLPFGRDEVLLQRVVRLVAQAVPAERIVCVAAADQSLPVLPTDVQIVRDPEPHLGPLSALATGFAARAGRDDAAFVCGCDTPLLVPALVERMFELLEGRQAIVPRVASRIQPLVAVYRSEVLPIAASLLTDGQRSLHSLIERCDARIVEVDALRDVDPDLLSLESCNTDEEYQRLLERVFPSRVGL